MKVRRLATDASAARRLHVIAFIPTRKEALVNHVDGFLRDGVEGCHGL